MPAESTVDDLASRLQSLWHTTIPLAVAIRIEVAELSSTEIVVSAGLDANRNLHGTAFAGSLFSVAALAGWGMTWAALAVRDLECSIVLARSRIRYLRAVQETIVCRCAFDWRAQQANLDGLVAAGKGVFPLAATIRAGTERAVHFEGDYAVRIDGPAGGGERN